MKKILLVEDEESLINVLELNLELENYKVVIARDGEEALSLFNDSIDLVILDVMLPKLNGFDVCSKIRESSLVPIIITSAKGTSTDRITGLKLGADDYLVKPFNLEELLLRMGKLLDRPVANNEIDNFTFGDNQINFKTYEIVGQNGSAIISKREMELLKLLIDRKNEVVSRDEILDHVWGEDNFPTSRTIDNYILNFRKYFEKDQRNPQYFKSLRGVGYKFVSK
ncbi:response regulator transcription factor [Paracrocinitomix mangrovi]|uniref:response regulator transcription factor n=1 Tax=Paracrocinitomix mangrovi TaxID=2862509 RepID=UPI001C8E81A5|nr:response regulator transcription factor [Paracrocinitomix mangrovi]UKN03395.1 response regulator transcription factor [Paracrocinitomix mangrovi]